MKVILKVLAGSHAYGMNTPESDEDIRGTFLPEPEHILGLNPGPEQIETKSPDLVLWEFRKFLKLGMACNPNILDVLFADHESLIETSGIGIKLRDLAPKFLSVRAADTFCGYAMAQLKRIESHRKWLLDPPKKQPTRADFGLKDQRLMSADQQGAYQELKEKGQVVDGSLPSNFLELLNKEKAYQQAQRHWDSYCSWKAHRNPARALLEAKVNFDCKHAAHLIRLLRMGIEIVEEGRVLVKRPDAEELLEIKTGNWTYEDVMEHAESLKSYLNSVRGSSVLPKEPDTEAINNFCMDTLKQCMTSA